MWILTCSSLPSSLPDLGRLNDAVRKKFCKGAMWSNGDLNPVGKRVLNGERTFPEIEIKIRSACQRLFNQKQDVQGASKFKY